MGNGVDDQPDGPDRSGRFEPGDDTARFGEPERATVGSRLDALVQGPNVRFGLLAGAVSLVVLSFFGFVYPAPLAVLFLGAVLGSLSALTAMGIVLIYRANRVVNFAQGDLGALAGVLSVSLIGGPRWGFFPAMAAGLVAGLALGAVIEVVIVRRFAKAPRLILTVATLGIAQLCVVGQLGVPSLFGFDLAPQDFPTPLDFTFSWDPVIFRGSHLLAVVVVPLAAFGLGAFFRFTRVGMAVRASAESSDRAMLLGIPVRRIGTLVWVLAAGMSALGSILRAPIVGVSIGSVLGPALLLRALAAAVIGRMENLWVTFAAAVALGIVEQAVVWHTGRTLVADAVLFFIIIAALLFQQRGVVSRAVERGASSWQSISEVRPVPAELRRLPEVRGVRVGGGALLLGLALLLPALVSDKEVNLASYGMILAILAVSLVILTGWAGQISLGQWAFAGFGGAVAGTLAQGGLDLPYALVAAGITGALISIAIGIPALRIRGPFLAVATFALALATSSFFLNPEFPSFSWYLPDPGERILRPVLFGKFDLESEASFYLLTLAILLLVLASVRSLRHSNIGRALIASRDNERAAETFGVNLVRARLTGFALSGFFAAIAGALFLFHQHGMFRAALRPEASIALFSIVVFGGLGSVTGALLGVTWFQFIDHFIGSSLWRLFTTGAGLLVVLWILPGGLGQVVYGLRDLGLRIVARRRDIVVPSLVADVRTDDAEGERDDVARRAVPDGLLTCRGIDVAYGKTKVLFDVDFSVQEGELLALLGTNGAGKSTLLNAISGLVKPTSGTITFEGVDITALPADRTAGLGIAMAPGGKGVFPTLTVAENFELAGWLSRGERERFRTETEEVLTRFPKLRERWDQKAGNLSGGEQQMLTLGQVFLARPKLLLIDELSLGLAPIIVEQLLEIVREIHRRGTTVILVEQSVNIATAIAERAVFMEKGEVRFDGPTKELIERPDVLRAVFLQGTAAATGTTPPGGGTGNGSERRPFRETCGECGSTHDVVLSAAELSVAFGGVRAVDGVTMSVREGEILGLIGPNGAGKTTLFDLLSGFVTPTSGRVELAGADLTALSPDKRAVLGLGRSFQDARLFPSLTVVENLAVALGRHLADGHAVSAALVLPSVRVGEERVAERIEELVELMHLGAFANKFVSELSTGSRRVVDLACALAHNPRVLLLDEPSSGIAQRETEELGPLLLDIRDRTGAALLVIEHDMPLITSVSDRLVALDLGRVVAMGTPEDVVNDELVVASYLGTSPDVIRRSGPGRGSGASTRRSRALVADRGVAR